MDNFGKCMKFDILHVCGLLGGWMDGLTGMSCQITISQINLDLIEIIQFCLQIHGLSIYPHAHTTHWRQSLAIEIMSITYSPTV